VTTANRLGKCSYACNDKQLLVLSIHLLGHCDSSEALANDTTRFAILGIKETLLTNIMLFRLLAWTFDNHLVMTVVPAPLRVVTGLPHNLEHVQREL
jgi:hypothetical protein